MIEEELSSCLRVDATHQNPRDEQAMLERFPTHKWEAARESASFQSLPPPVTAAVFAAYVPVYAFNRLVDRIEAAELTSWTSATQEGRSGAEMFRQNLLRQIRSLSATGERACQSALEKVNTELNSIAS